jgi:hypothetical protein
VNTNALVVKSEIRNPKSERNPKADPLRSRDSAARGRRPNTDGTVAGEAIFTDIQAPHLRTSGDDCKTPFAYARTRLLSPALSSIRWRRGSKIGISADSCNRLSAFGFRPSFGLRVSDFGFQSGISAFGLRISDFKPLRRAFSLIEIMVTVGLLTFIILGLLLMFNQTQRAFRAGMTQTDVLEAGRATMDLLARELEQMSPSQFPDVILNGYRFRTTNFFVEPWPDPKWARPLVQELSGNGESRTNLLQRFFFLSKVNQDWISTGYEVWPDDANNYVGTLYRFNLTNTPRGWSLTNIYDFENSPQTNLSRIADGIVHLRLRAFAKNGYLITTNRFTGTNASYALAANAPYTNMLNGIVYNSGNDVRQSACYFMSNALPGYLELELGILEPRILQKYRSIGVAAAAQQYLSNHAAQVHIFRQRIPVRNVDLSAYP